MCQGKINLRFIEVFIGSLFFLGMFIIFYMILAASFTAVTVSYNALIADKSHPLQRGELSTFMACTQKNNNKIRDDFPVNLADHCGVQWRIERGEGSSRPRPKFLNVYAVFGKIGQIIGWRSLRGWRPREILDPPLVWITF